jgi:glycogen debranching enzyme
VPRAFPRRRRGRALAADQFIIERHRDGHVADKTVIADYPWFSDWGRDT